MLTTRIREPVWVDPVQPGRTVTTVLLQFWEYLRRDDPMARTTRSLLMKESRQVIKRQKKAVGGETADRGTNRQASRKSKT